MQIFRKSGPHNFFDELNEDTEASSPAPPAFVEGGSGGPGRGEAIGAAGGGWWWWAVRYICCVLLAVSQFPLSPRRTAKKSWKRSILSGEEDDASEESSPDAKQVPVRQAEHFGTLL